MARLDGYRWNVAHAYVTVSAAGPLTQHTEWFWH